MKQVVQNYRSGELKLWEVPAPACGAGKVLVAVQRSLISPGTEKLAIDLAKASLAGKAVSRPDLVRQVVTKVKREGLVPTLEKVFAKLDHPAPLGYSVTGRVIGLGAGVSGLKISERVACAGAGYANHAEIVAVPKNLVVPVPDGVDDEDASFVTLGAIALQGVRQAQPLLGERFAVLGLGLIGQTAVQLLKANGCKVIGYDPDSQKCELAARLGADAIATDDIREAVAAFTSGFGADGVIVAASAKSSEPVNTAAELCRIKGRVIVVGMVGLDLERDAYYKKELDLRLSMSYGPGRYDPAYEERGQDYPFAYVRWTEQRNMQAFLELVAEGRVKPKALITHRFLIAQAEEAYALLDGPEPYLGIVFEYAGTSEVPTRTVRLAPPSKVTSKGVIAFIGAGNFAGSVLIPAFRAQEKVTLAAVAAATGLSAAAAAKKFGFARATTDVAEVMADPGIDTVVIATRHNLHAGLAAQALARGKHVFCEKPLATDPAGLEDVIEAHDASPGQLCAGFNRRFSPFIRRAQEAFHGRSGPLVMLYRVNAGMIAKDSWIQSEEGGGRVVGEVCHFIDTMVALCGALPEHLDAVTAKDHADALAVQISFADGSIGTIVYSSLGDPSFPKEYLEVFAAGCVVTVDDYRRMTITSRGKTRSYRSFRQDKGHRACVEAFMRTVREGGPPAIPFEQLEAVTRAAFDIEDALRGRALQSRTAHEPHAADS
ncbi:MAG: bi-domain-containing oxidoreductase [Beijerinckiaceae bacterium]|nr:bi-domain-containing oxidoreductase [Beijerinckiaceae bacterium]